ncbi:MAG: winged helix DNA-binding domain-containing protein [Propionibacteriaceae bacterium]|nr:winged helix DNA-binding domain-containing protein [Propionibacteriaceae bacterium]
MSSMHLTAGQARRIALAAQGIGVADRDRSVAMRQMQQVIDAVAQFQIDSVNVMVRAQLMPAFARLGAYDVSLLTRASTQRPQRLFEYWGHAASLIDIDLYPALRFRMADAHPWAGVRELVANHPGAADDLIETIRERGPSTASELNPDTLPRERGWWNWSDTKTLLEWLFHTGRVTVVRRNNSFERVFDLTERVLPAAAVQASPLGRLDSHVTLARRAMQALGVATTRSVAEYFRTNLAETRQAVAVLAEDGEIVPVTVTGTAEPMWLWAKARRPRTMAACALVSPFDSLAFDRRRLLELFGIDYTIGLYTPAAQRTRGYYAYLFVLDDSFAARVDLKADRQCGVLRVQGAWLEDGVTAPRSHVGTELCVELRRLAQWLGLTDITVEPVGDLSADVSRSA